MNNNLKTIISSVLEINDKCIHRNKIEGNYFNLIKLMGMASSEVNTHTPIIADLLNPNGQHGQGNIFLKLFLELFSIDFDIDYKVRVEKEKRVKNDQIDILIENESKIIIIENKVYASDQQKQLYRYYQYGLRQNKQPILIYLSMQNLAPSRNSLGAIIKGGDENYYLNDSNAQQVQLLVLNYRNDLLKWLDLSNKSLCYQQNIKSGIQQYINLILQMTGEIMSNKSEIKHFLNNMESNEFKAVSDLCNVYRSSEFRGELLSSFFDSVGKDISLIPEFSIAKKSENIDLAKINYSLDSCKKWFKSKNLNNRKTRDFIGVIFDCDISSSLKFFVVVVTEAMYYGFFSEDDSLDLKFLNEDSIWSMNTSSEKLGKVWFGKKECNVWNFDSATVELLNTNNNEYYIKFIENVISEFNCILDKFNQVYSK